MTIEDIVDAAKRVARCEGIGSISMRRLGRELGVTPMAIYHHVPDKQRLIDLLAEYVLQELLDNLDHDSWSDTISSFCREMRQAVRCYQGIGDHLLQVHAHGPTPSEGISRLRAELAQALLTGTSSPRRAAIAYGLLVTFVRGRIIIEQHSVQESVDAQYIGSLPADVQDVFHQLSSIDDDEVFELSVQLVLEAIKELGSQGAPELETRR